MVYINTTGKHNEVWLDKPYATITVECPECPSTEDAYNSGWTDGSEDGYHKGYQSGRTDGYDDGWGPGYQSGYTDAWQPAYDSGYTDGLEACSGSSCNLQDSKTVRLHNYEWTYYPGDHGHYGEYQLRHNPEIVSADTGYDGMKEIVLMGYIDASSAFTDGFNSGYSVGQETCSGVTPDLERKSIDLTSFFKYWPESQTYSISGSAVPYCVFPNSGYAGLERVCIYTNIDASEAIADGFQSGYTSGYSSGYTDGLNACSGGSEDLIANLQGQYYLIPYGTEWLRDYVFYYTCFSSITIPDTVVAIGSHAFAYNECLTSITIPDSVQSLGAAAFYRCTNLQTAILGSGLTKLESYTFQNCTSLTGITIPSGISQIEKFSFGNCSDLTEMTFEGLNPPTINTENSLGSKDYTFPIYVPCESVEAYKTAFGQYYEPRIMCNSGHTPDTEYLTIEAYSAGTLYWYANNSSFTRTIEYSKDKDTWSSVTSTNENSGTVITTVQAGDKVYLRGDNATYCDTEHQNYFKTDFKFDVYGNVMSLIDKEDFVDILDFAQPHALCSLFYSCTNLVSAADLALPATGLSNNCYEAMFYNCTSLTGAPVLPATVLVDRCYMGMFANCTSLTAAPELPATVLTAGCYKSMFQGCRNLTTAPELPAEVLAESCYENMFENSSLNNIKCLATDITANNSTYRWVAGTSNTGTFIKNASMSAWTTGINGIPENWTVQDAS